MAMQDFLATIKLALVGKEQVVAGINEIQQKLASTKVITSLDTAGAVTGKQIEQTFKPIAEESKKAAGGITDFTNAMRRALIVAPVWMLIREGISAVLTTLSEGARTWIQFDTEMNKSAMMLKANFGTMAGGLTEVEKSLTDFSMHSGIALEKLGSNFSNLVKMGLSASQALNVTTSAAKLAEATFDDSTKITSGFNIIMQNLGVTIDKNLTPLQRQEVLAGKIVELFQKNKFATNEFIDALAKFSPTAKIMNISMDQTLALFASVENAGMKASTGATSLRMALMKLMENTPKIGAMLGVGMTGNAFNDIINVLDRIHKLSTSGEKPSVLAETLKELGLGGRTGGGIAALNAVWDKLNANIATMGKTGPTFIKTLDDALDSVHKQAGHQVEIFHNLNVLIGKTFVEGVGGGKDFAEGLKNINAELQVWIPRIGEFAKGLHAEISGGFIPIISGMIYDLEKVREASEKRISVEERINSALHGQLTQEELIALITELNTKYTDKNLDGRQRILKTLNETGFKLIEQKATEEATAKAQQDQIDKTAEHRSKIEEMKTKIQDRLAMEKDEVNVMNLQAAGADSVTIAHKKLETILNVIVNRYNNLTSGGKKFADDITTAQLEALVLSGNMAKVFDVLKGMELTDDEINKLDKEYLDNAKAKEELAKKLYDHEMDLYKIRGVSNSVLLEAEIAYKTQLYGVDAVKKDLQLQFEIEKQITREKMNQVDISSDTVKLYRIAQQYGKSTAMEIGRFMTGEIDYSKLQQMPRVIEVFRKEFANWEEQIQAANYFGVPYQGKGGTIGGANRYYGAPGAEIPIKEYNLPPEMTDLISKTHTGTLPQLKEINVNGLTIQVTQEVKEIMESGLLGKKVADIIANEFMNNPKIAKAIQDKIIKPY